MSLRSCLLTSAFVPLLVFSRAASADGSLDAGFGAAGNRRVVLPFDIGSPPNDTLVDLVMDGDERPWLVGQVRARSISASQGSTAASSSRMALCVMHRESAMYAAQASLETWLNEAAAIAARCLPDSAVRDTPCIRRSGRVFYP